MQTYCKSSKKIYTLPLDVSSDLVWHAGWLACKAEHQQELIARVNNSYVATIDVLK